LSEKDRRNSSVSNSSRPLPHSRPVSPSQQRRQSNNPSISSATSRSSYLRGFLSRKTTSGPTPSSPTSSPSFPSINPNDQQSHTPQSSQTRRSKEFPLQKYYYPRNSMTMASATPSDPASPTKSSFSRMDSAGALAPLAFEGPRALGLIPPPTPLSASPPSIPQPSQHPLESSTATRLEESPLPPPSPVPLLNPTPSLILPPMPVAIPTKNVPTLTTDLASPLSPDSPPSESLSPSSPPSSLSLHPFALSNLSTSYSSSSSSSTFSAVSSPNTSPSNSPTEATSKPLISSPSQSNQTPYPARGISPGDLAAMIERGDNKQGVSAGPRPLVLDLRPNPDFDPISIVYSININLPTLLMRRYRKGGAVSAFALESFITIPSDKDLFHLIQDSWRQDLDPTTGQELAHDVIVLDQDMKAGNEEFGRSPSSAWTLLSVLERGGGGCGGPIRLWYLEGGFEAFQAWDQGEKFLMRPGCAFEMNVTQDSPGQRSQQDQQDLEATLAERSEEIGKLRPMGGGRMGLHPRSMSLSVPSSSTSSTFTDSRTAQAIENAVSMTNASLGSNPRRGPRRESLFSLNTKSLQRPAGLGRSQTVGVSALNIKPLSIAPSPPLPPPVPSLPSSLKMNSNNDGNGNNNNSSLHPLQEGPLGESLQRKGSWLTVPSGPGGVPAPSPIMSLSNSSMDISQSASSENTSLWSARSGDGQSQQGPMLNPKQSFSSSSTFQSLNSNGNQPGIQEEGEDGDSVHPFAQNSSSSSTSLRRAGSSPFDSNSSNNSGFQQEYQSRMFADGVDSYTNNHGNNQQQQQQQWNYDDEYVEGGEHEGEQEISCILANFLYLGPEIATEEQVQELERLGIKRVLNMARECEDLLVVNHPGMEYHKVGVHDHIEADVSTGLLQAVDIVSASDTPIYVHCKAGKSRSVTVIIAYLITHLHWSLKKAYNH
ncbi:hypothetical protein BGZ80_003801, partial [Entomortierella chlamydospora]